MTTVRMSGGNRKYTEIWNIVKRQGHCTLACSREDTVTIIYGVRKEKLHDSSKQKNKKLIAKPTDKGVYFKLVEDISINNL